MPPFLRLCLHHLGQPRALALLFLLFALPTGLGCGLLTPIGNVSDEPQHIARADGLRTGQIMGIEPQPQYGAGVMMNLAVFSIAVSEIYETMPGHPLSAATRAKAQAFTWNDQSLFCPTQMVHYLPTFYAPGALGMGLGKALGMSPLHAVFLGRIVMLLSFLAMGMAAIWLAGFGNALLFAVLTLPTTLDLGASYNQDGQIIAACALAAALFTRARTGLSPAWWAAVAILCVVGCAKTPYVPFLLVGLAPLAAPGLVKRFGVVVLASVPPAIWLLWLLHGHFSPWGQLPYHPGPLWPGSRAIWLTSAAPAYNIAVLKAHPLDVLWLPIISLIRYWPAIWPDILGMLSWGLVFLRPWEYVALSISVIVAALGAALGHFPTTWRGTDFAVVAVSLFGAFLGIELSQYVTFSLAGDDLIRSVYGRYYLPFLPFIIFLLPALARLPGTRHLKRPQAGWFALPAVAVAAVNVVALPSYIFHLYNMPGP